MKQQEIAIEWTISFRMTYERLMVGQVKKQLTSVGYQVELWEYILASLHGYAFKGIGNLHKRPYTFEDVTQNIKLHYLTVL